MGYCLISHLRCAFFIFFLVDVNVCVCVVWDKYGFILTLTRWNKAERQEDQPPLQERECDNAMTDGQERLHVRFVGPD